MKELTPEQQKEIEKIASIGNAAAAVATAAHINRVPVSALLMLVASLANQKLAELEKVNTPAV